MGLAYPKTAWLTPGSRITYAFKPENSYVDFNKERLDIMQDVVEKHVNTLTTITFERIASYPDADLKILINSDKEDVAAWITDVRSGKFAFTRSPGMIFGEGAFNHENPDYTRYVTLHEFGHVMGLDHEYLNQSNVAHTDLYAWMKSDASPGECKRLRCGREAGKDKETYKAIHDECKANNGEHECNVCWQDPDFFYVFDKEQYGRVTNYDKYSVMNYGIFGVNSGNIYCSEGYRPEPKLEWSEGDKEMLIAMYGANPNYVTKKTKENEMSIDHLLLILAASATGFGILVMGILFLTLERVRKNNLKLFPR